MLSNLLSDNLLYCNGRIALGNYSLAPIQQTESGPGLIVSMLAGKGLFALIASIPKGHPIRDACCCWLSPEIQNRNRRCCQDGDWLRDALNNQVSSSSSAAA